MRTCDLNIVFTGLGSVELGNAFLKSGLIVRGLFESEDLALSGGGNNQIVEIAFDSGVMKKFAAAYAPITPLEE